MASLSPKDRVSLCLFSFTDGRRCRTPRTGNHPHFCFYHAQKEARAQATEKLAKDLAYFFSGDYLSACDLSTALSRLIPAVVRGDIKPRLARTVAYMFQTQLQAIHLSQREYVNAFGLEGWRKALRNSVDSNSDYLFPSDPGPEQPAPSAPPQPQQPIASSPNTPACRQQSAASNPHPPSAVRPTPTQAEAALSVARSLFPRRPNSAPIQPPAPTPSPATHAPQPPSPANHPSTQSAQPNNPRPPAPPPRQPKPTTPNRDPYAVHYDHNYRLVIDGKPF